MPRLTILALSLFSLTACDTQGGDFDDVDAIAATKVEVCHFNQGQGEYALVDVAENAVESHLGHGDTLFANDGNCDSFPRAQYQPWLEACLEEYGLETVAEFESVSGFQGYEIHHLACFCDCSWCFDCGLDTLAGQNGCECANIFP